MKKITSIKFRITVWYTSLMFVLIAVVLALVGTLSYKLSIDNIEKNVTSQVSQIATKLSSFERDVFGTVDSDEEFKNVTIYDTSGAYLVGQYIYDVSNIEFKDGVLRRETVDGKEYIIYDVKKESRPMPVQPPNQNSGENVKPPEQAGGETAKPSEQSDDANSGNHQNDAQNGTRQNSANRPKMQDGNRGDGVWIRGAQEVNSTILFGRSAFTAVLIIVPLILLLAALGGYYIAKKSFSPINEIISTANDISQKGDIKKRIGISDGAKRDELYNLSVTLNHMLDKIEFLIKKEKQFTSDASHELRTPISVILAQGEYLLDVAQSEKEKELAETITAKANQMSKLISRLLLLSRIDGNRQKIFKEKVDIAVIADISAESLRALADEKGIKINVNVPENTIVEADEALILSAVTNLVSNGVKYGKNGGYVNISAVKNNGKTEIAVSDNGMGISDENISKIWDRFYRADDVRNDEYGSCGLGLSMVKSIAELHGGGVSVKSKLGKGTEFKIVL